MNDADSNSLWYETPAEAFFDSLVLGNGRLGAMVFGGVDEERIVLNENSLCSGSRDPEADRPEAWRALPEIRRLLMDGKNLEAEAMVNAHFTCQGPGSGQGNGATTRFGCYQVFGTLRLGFSLPAAPVSGYRRRLDLQRGRAVVGWSRGLPIHRRIASGCLMAARLPSVSGRWHKVPGQVRFEECSGQHGGGGRNADDSVRRP